MPRFIREHQAQIDLGAALVASSSRLCDSKKYGTPSVLRYGISGDGSNLTTKQSNQTKQCALISPRSRTTTSRRGKAEPTLGLPRAWGHIARCGATLLGGARDLPVKLGIHCDARQLKVDWSFLLELVEHVEHAERVLPT